MKYAFIATTVLGVLALAVSMYLWIFMTLEMRPFDPPVFKKGSTLADIFANPPAPSYLHLYAFNITNSDDWLNNETQKVVLQECGPYVFRMNTMRSLHWSGENLSFDERTNYYFEASESNGTLDDVITTVDFTALLLFKDLKAARQAEESIFVNASISQYFFDGFKKANKTYAHWRMVNNGAFAWFGDLNSTVIHFAVQTKPEFVNQIVTYGRARNIPGYGLSCGNLSGKIAGSSLLPAFSTSPATVEVFEPSLGVPWTLHLEKQYNFGYEPIARFIGDRDIFSVTPKTCKSFLPTNVSGMFDASPVYSYAPARRVLPTILSLPHFLYVDPAQVSNIDGLTPNESKHGLYIDVHAPSGVVVDTRLRSQLSLLLLPLDESLDKMILPIFWQEISRRPEGKKEMVEAAKAWPYFSGWVAAACAVSLLAAALFFGASVLLLGPVTCSNIDEERPHTPDDIPTEELSSEPEEDLRREQRRRALRARLPAGLPVYFKIHEGDLDDLGVTIPEWVMDKLRQQMEEQDSDSSSTDEDSSVDDLPSAVESCTWSTVSSRSTSPEPPTSRTPATPDEEDVVAEQSIGCPPDDIEEVFDGGSTSCEDS